MNKKFILSSAVVLSFLAVVYAADTVIIRYLHRGTSNQAFRLQSDGSVAKLTLDGPVLSGDSDTSPTLPTSATASYYANWVPVYNPLSSSIAAGTVLVSSNTGIGYVRPAGATIDLTGVVGVAAETIGAASKGWMVPRGGGYAMALTTGTIAIGDVLITSGTVAGRLGPDSTPTTGADIAVAMEAGDAAGDSIVVLMR